MSSEEEDKFFDSIDDKLKGYTEMMQAAVALNEMHKAFMDAGFTELQSMELLKAVIASRGEG